MKSGAAELTGRKRRPRPGSAVIVDQTFAAPSGRSVERDQARIERGKEDASRARAFLRTGAPIGHSAADHQIPEAPALVDLRIEGPDLASGLGVESDHAVERSRKDEPSID